MPMNKKSVNRRQGRNEADMVCLRILEKIYFILMPIYLSLLLSTSITIIRKIIKLAFLQKYVTIQ